MTRIYRDGYIPLWELPDVLGSVSYFRIWSAARAGKIPAQKIAGRWFLPYGELETVLDFFGIPFEESEG